MKIGYILWLLVTGVTFAGVRIIGNPFSNEVQYRIEYTGGVGKTLWGNYSITPHNKSQSVTTERAIGQRSVLTITASAVSHIIEVLTDRV